MEVQEEPGTQRLLELQGTSGKQSEIHGPWPNDEPSIEHDFKLRGDASKTARKA